MPTNTDVQRRYGGFSALPGGIDMGTDPSLLPDVQAAFASNLSFTGDLPVTRQPWLSVPLSTPLAGLFQGATCYSTNQTCALVASINGRLYRIDLESIPAVVTDITPVITITVTEDFIVPAVAALVLVSVTSEAPFAVGDTLTIEGGTYTVVNRAAAQLTLSFVGGDTPGDTIAAGTTIFIGATLVTLSHTNPATLDFVWLFQAEQFLIVLARQQKSLIYDGTKTIVAGPTQVPSGILGLYSWGRLWIVLPDERSFVAGDIVYGPSGTAFYNYADALLYFTENDFLNEGGFFSVPNNAGNITAMQSLATIDSSLGIGPILVGTTGSVISVNAPPDRTTWKNLTYPIQTISLLDYGPVGPRFTTPVNNDMWYRSLDGFRSFIVARRDTTSWGNTPMSHEVSPILRNDTPAFLYHGSSILFDNRFIGTVAPNRVTQGIAHEGLAFINFDSLSTLRGKQPAIWEGLGSGLSILQLVRATVQGTERAFAFVAGEDDAIELWELLPESTGFYDTFRSVGEDGSLTLVRTPIKTVLETKRYVYDHLVKLIMAELYLDDIVDDISLRILWKPDQYPSWVDWATIDLCASVTQCTLASPGQFSCTLWKPNARTYAARIRLPRPPEACNELAGIPLDRMYEAQFRLEGTGHFRLRKFRPHLRIQTDAMEGECPASAVCAVFPYCPPPWTSYEIARS